MRSILNLAKLCMAVILLCIAVPSLALAGIKGIIGGNWEAWNKRMQQILG